jgi:Ca2+-binding RTX toxin-like protein
VPRVERLERKDLMAVTITGLGTWINAGIPVYTELKIVSDNAGDTVAVEQMPGKPSWVSVYINGAFYHNYAVARPDLMPAKITFIGNGGNDTFTNDTNRITYADGGAGDDVLTGGSSDDTLIGGGGNDSLYGRDGNDTLSASNGTVQLYGGAGNDTLSVVGVVNSYLDGGAGNDTLSATAAFDTVLNGGADNDTLSIGAAPGHNITLLGGPGADKFVVNQLWWLRTHPPVGWLGPVDPGLYSTPDRVASEPLVVNRIAMPV